MLRLIRPNVPAPSRWIKHLELSYAAAQFSNFGPLARQFESRVEKTFDGSRSVLTVNSCTDGLTAMLTAMGASGKVVLPSFTFAATAQAVLRAGCTPVFCDCSRETLGLSGKHLEQILSSEKIAAVMPVRVFGFDHDLSPVEDIAKRFSVPVIIDSAGAFAFNGVRSLLKFAGRQGDAEIFSFHATKLFNVGEGGAVIAKPSWLASLRSAVNFGLEEGTVVRGGLNAKLSEFHAAIALTMLDDIGVFLEHRQKIADEFYAAFSKLAGVERCWPGGEGAWSLYPLLLAKGRDPQDILVKAAALGLETRRYYYPALHRMPHFKPWVTAELPASDDISSRMLCLPLFSDMSADESQFVITVIKQVLS
jgi:dTDP-4-amino-4,6-dideoxygalactose transaminase